MRFRFFSIAALLLGLVTVSSPASAAFILANTNGGNGYVTVTSNGFILVGSNNESGSGSYTTYTDIASSSSSYTFTYKYTYTTNDEDGGSWDPAGYILGGSYHQLSLNSLNEGESVSGVVTLNVLAGQTFGFYVHSLDNLWGAGQIAVTNTPLPAALPLFGSALLGMGLIARKKRA